jgi:hypothetical protein
MSTEHRRIAAGLGTVRLIPGSWMWVTLGGADLVASVGQVADLVEEADWGAVDAGEEIGMVNG